jgi:TolB-like protein/DNA-binding winged helix-turn-helix (wHTH) protein/Tfp pilus assembly protein PilF
MPDHPKADSDMEQSRPQSVIRFGAYEVSLQSGEMRKSGLRVKVQQLPMKLLEILLERPGEVITREELRSRVWPNETIGDFDQALNIAIGKLRNALGDSAENPRFIETVPKRGYRFIAEVTTTDVVPQPAESAIENLAETDLKATPDPSIEDAEASVPGRRRFMSRYFPFGVRLTAVLVLAALAAWFFLSRAHPPIRSLAVLPLENLSGDASQEYFADGMTDELITDLAQISALRVISRTSVMAYKGARKPLPEIARELNVDAVVEGTVQRSGDRVRITAQLIQAPDDKHLWAESYEGNLHDSLALQEKVASAIAARIKIELTPREQAGLKTARVVSPEALEAYLRGRFFWNKRTADGLTKAVGYFNDALEKDPSYAQAYAGLADSYALLGDWEYGVLPPGEAYPKAKAAAMKALELDDTLGEAHTSLAFSLDVFDWDWSGAEGEYSRAIGLSPGYATAHQWYAWHLTETGRNDEAIAEMRKAEDLDPLSLIISADTAEILLIAHQNDKAIDQSQKTIDMDPNFALAHYELGQALVQKHSYNEAIAEFQRAIELSRGSIPCTSNLAYAYAQSNRRDEALKILNDLKARPTRNPSEIALMYVGLDDKDQAMRWLEMAYDEHFNPSILLRPAFDPLRSDPRFQNLVRRIGLPG